MLSYFRSPDILNGICWTTVERCLFWAFPVEFIRHLKCIIQKKQGTMSIWRFDKFELVGAQWWHCWKWKILSGRKGWLSLIAWNTTWYCLYPIETMSTIFCLIEACAREKNASPVLSFFFPLPLSVTYSLFLKLHKI